MSYTDTGNKMRYTTSTADIAGVVVQPTTPKSRADRLNEARLKLNDSTRNLEDLVRALECAEAELKRISAPIQERVDSLRKQVEAAAYDMKRAVERLFAQ